MTDLATFHNTGSRTSSLSRALSVPARVTRAGLLLGGQHCDRPPRPDDLGSHCPVSAMLQLNAGAAVDPPTLEADDEHGAWTGTRRTLNEANAGDEAAPSNTDFFEKTENRRILDVNDGKTGIADGLRGRHESISRHVNQISLCI